MPNIIHKVTAFITRETSNGRQLLLFKHPTAGIQLPAGTVDEGELVETAVMREVAEETGLRQLKIIHKLGAIENELASNELILTQNIQPLFEPNANAIPFQRMFMRGMTVQNEGQQGAFTKISYLEYDQLPNPTAVAFQLIGYVPNEAVSKQKRRHFFHLDCWQKTKASWTVRADQGHIFAPFWMPLTPKPALVSEQDKWLDFVYAQLTE